MKSKSEYIRNGRDFAPVLQSGVRNRRKFLIILAKPNGNTHCRLGIIASRKAGNAVFRNRFKRLVREFYRMNRHKFFPGQDIVIIAGKSIPFLDFGDIEKDLRVLVEAR